MNWNKNVISYITIAVWAGFKYCGTKTAPMRRKLNDEKI
jgi:hypothetical protein